MKKMLLHTCCGPCAYVYVCGLDREGIVPDMFWYNHNIHPYKEYEARKNALATFCDAKGLALVVDDCYGLRDFVKDSVDKLDSRCGGCYQKRLEATAKKAAEGGYDSFSTTLLASPYQQFDTIVSIGLTLAKKYNIEFVVYDFRAGFKEGKNQARQMGLYIQKYCGCIFSEEERYVRK